MENVEEKVILDNKNQITSYEIDTGIVKLGYIYNNKKKNIVLEFDLLTDEECDFIEHAFYKNPILKEELINSKLNFYFFEYLLKNNIKIIVQSVQELNLPSDTDEFEKLFLFDSLRSIIFKNPLLALFKVKFSSDN